MSHTNSYKSVYKKGRNACVRYRIDVESPNTKRTGGKSLGGEQICLLHALRQFIGEIMNESVLYFSNLRENPKKRT